MINMLKSLEEMISIMRKENEEFRNNLETCRKEKRGKGRYDGSMN